MNKCILFAVIAFVAVAGTSAKPGYLPQPYVAPYKSYSSPLYVAPSVSLSAAAAAAAASSVAAPGYLLNVPSYVIDGGNYDYSIVNPGYVKSYVPVY